MLKLSKITAEYSNLSPFPAPIASWDGFTAADYLLTVKGAPEILLPQCSFVLSPNGGEPISLTQDIITRIVGVQESWAVQGQRVLLLARKVIREEEIPNAVFKNIRSLTEIVNDLKNDLIIAGLVGLIDPLKEDIIETVR